MSGDAADNIPTLKYGNKVYPQNLIDGATPVETGDVWFVDGDRASDGAGKTWKSAFKLIQSAIDASGAGDVIYVAGRTHTDYTGDPVSYAETLIIPYTSSSLSIIGISRGRTQGGLPQIKKGSGAIPLLTIRAPGCLISNLGFNGSGSTGGGILLDDDYSTKAAFGTTIQNCHIKNCVGGTATSAITGGGVMWSAEGNAWQTSIIGNLFYKNVGDIVLKGTSNTRPQDILVQGNEFKSSVTSSCHYNILGGTGTGGFQTITVDNNLFSDIPALGASSNPRYFDLTGTLGGMVTRNMFGCQTGEGGTQLTFESAGTAVFIPATIFMANNYGQFVTGTGAGLESGEVFA